MADLTLEVRVQADESPVYGDLEAAVVFAPLTIGEDYWRYRVQLTDEQAILGLPKFGTVGIGFAKEEDWNCNLPYRTCSAEKIYEHIAKNAGDDPAITRERCIEAIELIRAAAAHDQGTELDG